MTGRTFMNIRTYVNRIPAKWIIKDSFLDRNSNLSYLLTYEGRKRQSILIDANVGVSVLDNDLQQLGSTLKLILLTHSHLDHSFRLPEITAKYDTLVGIHPLGAKNTYPDIANEKFIELADGNEIKVGTNILTVVLAPGHTADALCFWDKKNRLFFAGDVILGGEIGCCDYLSGGDRNIFYTTIANLLQLLPDQTNIFPGHRLSHYAFPPPYLWSQEKTKNLFLGFAIAGEKSKFNRAMKKLSGELEPDNQEHAKD